MSCHLDNFKHFKEYDRKECCDYINNGECSKELENDLWEPLEIPYPSLFGELDKNQTNLIRIGGTDLILMENASEFIGRIKDTGNFLEKVIQKIIDDNKSDYISLGSHTIIYEDEEDRKRVLNELKKKIKPGKKYVLHLGLDFGKEGGHYSIMFQTRKGVVVFDSMQGWIVGRKILESIYTEELTSFAYELFNEETIVLLEDMISSPQVTGGFVSRNKYNSYDEYFKAYQDMDSQNHYCYFWSIAYFHIFIMEGGSFLSFKKFFKLIKCNHNHPLTFIKKYIWAILNMIYPSQEDLEKFFATIFKTLSPSNISFLVKFFLIHFRYVWDNLDTNFFQSFSIIPCNLSEVRSFENINQAMIYAFEKTPYVLDKITEKDKKILEYDNTVLCIKYSSDGKFLASCEDKIRIRNIDEKINKKIDIDAKYLVFSPDNMYLACATQTECKIYSRIKNTSVSLLESPKINSVAYSPDGKYFLNNVKNQLDIRDSSGNLITSLIEHKRDILCISSIENSVATGSMDTTVRIWDLYTYKCVSVLKAHTDSVNTLDYCPTKKYLASGSSDGTVIIWNLRKKDYEKINIKSKVFCVSYSNNGKYILIGAEKLYIYNTETKNLLTIPTKNPVFSCCFSPDGFYIRYTQLNTVVLKTFDEII